MPNLFTFSLAVPSSLSLCSPPSISIVIYHLTQLASFLHSACPNHINLSFFIVKVTGFSSKESLILVFSPFFHLGKTKLAYTFPSNTPCLISLLSTLFSSAVNGKGVAPFYINPPPLVITEVTANGRPALYILLWLLASEGRCKKQRRLSRLGNMVDDKKIKLGECEWHVLAVRKSIRLQKKCCTKKPLVYSVNIQVN